MMSPIPSRRFGGLAAFHKRKKRTRENSRVRWMIARAGNCLFFFNPVLYEPRVLSAFDYFDDGLGLDDHQVLIKQVEALNEQLMAAAFNIQHAQARSGFRCREGL